MTRVTPAPALSRDLGAIPKLDDSPPEYNEVIQEEINMKKDVENARKLKVKKRGCCNRTLMVFKIMLVLMLLATFAFAIFITYRLSSFEYMIRRDFDNLQRNQEDLYSTIYAMERRLDSNHPTTTKRPHRPAGIHPNPWHGFRNGRGGW